MQSPMSQRKKTPFVQKISRYIENKELLNKDGKYIVALSGGADSTALLLVMRDLGYNIEAAHCNFRLRGDESERDENFCAHLCRSLGIHLHRAHFDTREYAECRKISIEMAARDLRYSYLRQLKNDIAANGICVAHHSDDSAETLLINLIRGTGIEGLCGIRPVNDDIVRPLLCVSRREIEIYINEKKQSYIFDSTNLHKDLIRNKIRLDVIPLLETINPSVTACISRTAEHVAEAVKMLSYAFDTCAAQVVSSIQPQQFWAANKTVAINIDMLKRQPAPEYLLFNLLKGYDFAPAQIDEIWDNIDAQTGTEYASSSHLLAMDRGNIVIEPIDTEGTIAATMPEDGSYLVSSRLKIRIETIERKADFVIDKGRYVCSMDAGRISFPLHLRVVRAGDRFVPFGMNGSKLVSDFLTEQKLNVFDKRRQLLITDATGRVLWLVGLRADNRNRITTGTMRVVRIVASSPSGTRLG